MLTKFVKIEALEGAILLIMQIGERIMYIVVKIVPALKRKIVKKKFKIFLVSNL